MSGASNVALCSIAEIRLTARGKRSGMEIDQRFFQLYRVDGERIRQMDEFVTRSEAVAAADSSG